MKDAKNFLRFILPGITSIILLLIALKISDSDSFNRISNFTDSNSKSIGVVIGLFLTSGGLGYIYSQIYWGLNWHRWICNLKIVAIDFRPILNKLVKNNKLSIVNELDVPFTLKEIEKFTKRDAWTIMTIHYPSTVNFRDGKSAAEIVLDSVINITHSLGATIIGMIIAFIVWFVVHCCFNDLFSVKVLLIIIIWFILIYLLGTGRYQTLKAQLEISNTLFVKGIYDHSKYPKFPIEILYVKSN